MLRVTRLGIAKKLSNAGRRRDVRCETDREGRRGWLFGLVGRGDDQRLGVVEERTDAAVVLRRSRKAVSDGMLGRRRREGCYGVVVITSVRQRGATTLSSRTIVSFVITSNTQ